MAIPFIVRFIEIKKNDESYIKNSRYFLSNDIHVVVEGGLMVPFIHSKEKLLEIKTSTRIKSENED